MSVVSDAQESTRREHRLSSARGLRGRNEAGHLRRRSGSRGSGPPSPHRRAMFVRRRAACYLYRLEKVGWIRLFGEHVVIHARESKRPMTLCLASQQSDHEVSLRGGVGPRPGGLVSISSRGTESAAGAECGGLSMPAARRATLDPAFRLATLAVSDRAARRRCRRERPNGLFLSTSSGVFVTITPLP